MTEAAASIPAERGAVSRHSDFTFLLQVSRPGLWTTTALFYLMPLGHAVAFYSARFWVGLVYVLIPLGFVLYGVNDIFDAEADRLNPRKGTFLFGSRGRKEQLAALRWQIVVIQVPFVAAFVGWIGLQFLVWLGVLLGSVALYNAPRIGCKAHPPFDVLMQTSYLLVFVLSSWVNGVPQLPWQTFLFGALFAMHAHLFGEVMDVVPDRESGRRTNAVRIGASRTKLLMAGLLAVEVVLLSRYFHDWVVAALLGSGAAWFVADALLLWRDRPYGRKLVTAFMLAWNATAVLFIVRDYVQEPFTRILGV